MEHAAPFADDMAPEIAGVTVYDPLGVCTDYPGGGLWDALREVEDPELGISLVDMGLIVAIQHDEAAGAAHVWLTYTAMGCPATEFIEGDIRERLLREPGIREVRITVVWEPAWTKRRLSPQGRDALLASGVAV